MGGPEGVEGPKGGGPKISLFFPLPPQFSFSRRLLGGVLVKVSHLFSSSIFITNVLSCIWSSSSTSQSAGSISDCPALPLLLQCTAPGLRARILCSVACALSTTHLLVFRLMLFRILSAAPGASSHWCSTLTLATCVLLLVPRLRHSIGTVPFVTKSPGRKTLYTS